MAGWSGGGVVMIFGCNYVEDVMVDVLMLWLLLCDVLRPCKYFVEMLL